MADTYTIHPVGLIRKKDDTAWIEIFAEYREAMLGLEGFSHIHVFFWFHENDTAELRRTLQVHPRKDPSNPLTGVFATHSPKRPNLIGLTRCRIRGVAGNRIAIDAIDARDGSPVIDIKCFIPDAQPLSDVRLPDWV
ncbi:MAG TPA: tRNA (N6-threonylcarbamoyladenosine(37)-N6)-methyltransferase TrmO [Desulfobacterales bacterium]|nr:tRNA (N6-threonylcarbamoyladenosine(37)-N6)-methyltransferase TrmO [Desulfobacterales bacterium]HSM88497.1 tRNA (N6-threonylcarbamoyladenosine(37)-N6)-methyltransferase TrmO [Desulfobacterales bacterium]